MKKIYIKNISLIIGLSALLALSSCTDKIDPVIDEMEFDRAFTPVGLYSEISNVTTVTLSWSAVKNADHYTVEIYEGEEFVAASLVVSADVDAPEEEGIEVSYEYELPAGDTEFSARVKAISALEGVDESKWATISFRSDPENLFTGYVSELTGLNSCVVRWTAGETVTALVFDDGTTETSYPISAAEMAAGEKILSGVPNATYEIRIMNSTFVRGRINLIIEGDVLLAAGGDLTTTLDAMSAGQVLILTNGASYGLVETDTIMGSIKIRGLYPEDLPTIYLMTGGGNHMFDVDPSMTEADSVVFENVDISCYYDDAGVTRHRGVFDVEGSAVHLGALKFKNCIIRDSGRSVIRLRGNVDGQVINTVSFENCIMYDFAWDSHYGMVNPNASTATIKNIIFSNSTVYNIRGGIVLYGSGVGCESVVVKNCTFDQTMMDASSGRWFIDFGTGTSTGAITISNCIFGQSSAVANGVRPSQMSLTVTGSYYTTDFVDLNGVLKAALTAYSGASTTLWTDPSTADYTISDTSFEGSETAGDPRWMD